MLALYLFLIGVFLICAIVYGVICFIKNEIFKGTTYHKVTGNTYFQTISDVGRLGEYKIYERLRPLEKSGCKFLFNLYISKENGETTEIDALLLTRKGVFVFESKNFSGWIFGSDNQRYWTQTLPKGRGRSHKERFLNPIWQNKGHIKYLKSLIDDSIPVHSVVVFSDRCTLKDIKLNSGDVPVIRRFEIEDTVLRICRQTDFELSDEQVNGLYEKLYPYSQVDAETKKKHIDDILGVEPENAISDSISTVNNTVEETRTCPRCGANLVLRQAKRGDNKGNSFYGCYNFPKCRYIENVSEQTQSIGQKLNS